MLQFQELNPSSEPTELIAGDSVKWTKELDDYPASAGWSMKYYFQGMNPFDVEGTVDGDGYDFFIDATTSHKIVPGLYLYKGQVSKGDERYTVAQGKLNVLPDPVNVVSGQDLRTPWKITLDNLETILQNKSIKGYEEVEVSFGTSHRRVKDMSWQEIINAYHHAKRQVRSEEDAERLSRGLMRRKILTRAEIPQ